MAFAIRHDPDNSAFKRPTPQGFSFNLRFQPTNFQEVASPKYLYSLFGPYSEYFSWDNRRLPIESLKSLEQRKIVVQNSCGTPGRFVVIFRRSNDLPMIKIIDARPGKFQCDGAIYRSFVAFLSDYGAYVSRPSLSYSGFVERAESWEARKKAELMGSAEQRK